MKKILFTSVILSQISFAGTFHNFDLPPDATGSQYLAILNQLKSDSDSRTILQSDIDLEPILELGKRNWEWLNHLNALRSKDDQLAFSAPGKSRGFPVKSARHLSKEFITSEYNKVLATLPKEMLDVLLKKQDFTNELPASLSKDDYLKYGLQVDYAYQNAARWNLLYPYKEALKEARFKDIRGYYNLEQLTDRSDKLKNFNTLAEEEKQKIGSWLENQCLNTEHNEANCHQYFVDSSTANNGNATEFYQKYFNQSQKVYLSFFKIPTEAVRNDILWTKGPKQTSSAIIPFQDVDDPNVKNFLHNIEKAWQWENWQLSLQYTHGDNIPNIAFESGVTPHVNELGGNNIVMDANQPLAEWDAQWTIRHEFGHVLGFPDCYIEFFDENTQAFISYQIDVNNLMCSRKGETQQTHYLEMVRNYAMDQPQ